MDTLRECCTGSDENDATEMQEVIAYLTEAVKPSALVLVAHSKKPPQEGEHSIITGNRGSSYITGKMDGVIQLTKHAMGVTGRACEEASIPIHKVAIPGGFYWAVSQRSDVVASQLVAESGGLKEKAKRMSEMTGRSEAACLAELRQLVQSSLTFQKSVI